MSADSQNPQSAVPPIFSLPVRDAASKFLREHADGSPLFPAGSFTSDAALARRAEKADRWAGDRAALVDFLKTQNDAAFLGTLHPAQEESLTSAARPDALFVLTGQQPGLLGGPALGFHKAMSAVAWARASALRLNRPVIPVFWAAGDDSDLAESNAVEFLEPRATVTSLSLDFSDAAEAIPMSRRVLTAAARRALLESLPTDWSPATRALAEDCYAPGRSLTEAFLRLMQLLLGPEGVLFVDGLAATQRPESQSVLRRVARDTAGFQDALMRGTTRLRETLNLPPQVPVRPGTVPVFLLENDRRVRLFSSDSGRVYRAGDEGHDLGSDLERLTLTHSALTRPLVVEALFPVLGHVLGPAEIRYFAQLADVFPAFGFTVPLLAPRQQALVITREDLATLVDLGFSPQDLADLRPSRVREHLTADAWRGHPAAAAFPDEDYSRFRDALASYEAERFPASRFDAARRRLDRAFGYYRDTARKLVFAESASERFRSLQPLLRWIAGGAQDRHLCVLSLWDALNKSSKVSEGSEGLGGAVVTSGFAAQRARLRQTGDVVSAWVLESGV